MSEGLNRVMLMGHLGADPELRYTQGGQAVLNLRLATTERYKDKSGEWKDRTDWHSITVWGKRGEALGKILAKGSSIFVEGSLRTSKYQDREGNDRYKTEVVAHNIILCGGKGRGAPAEDDGREPEPARGGYVGAGGRPVGRAPTPAEPPPDDYNMGGGFGDDGDIPFVYIGSAPESDTIPRSWL